MDGRTIGALGAAAGLILLSLPAFAESPQFCVTCSGPHQTYKCTVTGADGAPPDALKLYCVIRVTKDGHHSRCSARVNNNCHGIQRTYALNGAQLLDSLAASPQVQKFKSHMADENKKFETPPPKPDGTPARPSLFSLTKRGIDNAKERLGYGEPPPPPPGSSQPPGPPPGASPPRSSASAPPPPSGSSAPPRQASTSAVGSFASRSYRCLRSFFRHCGSDSSSAN